MAKKILVVDDERHIVRLIQVNLERQGYQTVVAFDGKEALQKVASESPDLIVLDVMMPYVDGFEVLKELKRNPDTRDIPVIMLTAKRQDADMFRSWGLGANDYLTKPFALSDLFAFLKRLFYGGVAETREKILVVHEEMDCQNALGALLEQRGYEVIPALSGEEGLAEILAERPDLIVLDAVLPDMDSAAFLQTLREMPEAGIIPVIVIAPDEQEAARFETVALNITACIAIPSLPLELLKAIVKILEAKKRPPEVQ